MRYLLYKKDGKVEELHRLPKKINPLDRLVNVDKKLIFELHEYEEPKDQAPAPTMLLKKRAA